MTKNILCLWCYKERKPQIAFSETSSQGVCETCFEGLFASVFQEFSWKQKLGFFFRRLFRMYNAMPSWHDRDIVPVKSLTELILTDMLQRGVTKIRYTLEQRTMPNYRFTASESNDLGEVDINGFHETTQFSVLYLIDNEWHEMMRPPNKLHAEMISRLKLMANISLNENGPWRGKIFFRHSAPLLQLDDSSVGLVITEELFLVDFQTSADLNVSSSIVELTHIPSKHPEP